MVGKALPIGAGGFVNGLDIAADGTIVVRTDVGGGYASVGGTIWRQVLLSTTLPVSDPAITLKGGTGLYELAVAPSLSSRMYMFYTASGATSGNVYRSDDYGVTWTATSFSTTFPSIAANANDQNTEQMGRRIAVDPINADIAYVGTPSSGLYKTSNAGGNWFLVSAVGTGGAPSYGGQNCGHIIAFDPNSAQTLGVTQGIYVSTYGTGVYHSSDGGANWALTTSSPTTHQHMVCDISGNLYLIDDSLTFGQGVLHKFASSAWSTVTTSLSNLRAIAVNPTNASEIVVMDGAGAHISYSSGGSGGPWSTLVGIGVATDIPWLQNANTTTIFPDHLSVGDIRFDPSHSSSTAGTSTLYMAEGTGVWKCQVTGSGTQTWRSQSAGIEELVVDWIVSPPGGNPLVACYDRPVFTITNPNSYCTQYGPTYAQNILEGYSVDYASTSPSTVVVLAQNGPNAQLSYSTNGGGIDGAPSNWHLMTGLSQIVDMNGSGGTGTGGCIAASTSNNFVVALNNGSAGGPVGIWATSDQGANWTRGTCPSFVSGTDGWGDNRAFNRQILAADRVTAGTFFAYNEGPTGGTTGGVYRSTDGGFTWTLQSSGRFDTSISPIGDRFNAQIRSVPGNAGHVFYTSGDNLPNGFPLHRSVDGAGVTWTSVPNVTDVFSFGFGKASATGSGYPTIYLFGVVNGTLGLWQGVNIDTGSPTWTQLDGQYVLNRLDPVKVVEGDMNTFGTCYVGFSGSGVAIFSTASTPAVGFSVIHGHVKRQIKTIGY